MGDSIDSVVKSWLVDPQWQKVFKHTFDVFQDYISYVLVSVGLVSLSVRLLNTLGSGEVMCVLVGVQYNGTSSSILVDPYPIGGSLGMLAYAQNYDGCIRAVLSYFMDYLPFILLLQSLALIIVEKFTFRMPRVAQKVERFHKNIVEDSLFGNGPDVAEDMTDPKTSTEVISRRRQRNEICVSMKRSSIIHNVYILKNCLEIFLCAFFVFFNVSSALVSTKPIGPCVVDVAAFTRIVELPGKIFFQCQAKKVAFFLMALRVHIALLILYAICSIGSILWCLFFRSVTGLIRSIQSKTSPGKPLSKLKRKLLSTMEGGKDFLFLFDLLAHTCGLESTLRVLTHSDETFYLICKPKLDHKTMLSLEEDRLRIVWSAADIEVWLKSGRKNSQRREIVVDSYEVTIFPAESVNNTQTVPASDSGVSSSGRKSIFFFNLPRSPSSPDVESKFDDIPEPESRSGLRQYRTLFTDLNGGRTEYVITIACMIGKSRMKGEKVVTNLVPYGPEKPRSGMVRSTTTKQVEIFWDPPKGEFTKYNLLIDHLDGSNFGKKISGDRRPSSPFGGYGPSRLDTNLFLKKESTSTGQRKVENLSYKLSTYTILGLEPGECYKITLGTKTGNVDTRYPISDVAMTRPNEVKGLRATNVTSSSCLLTWMDPESGHACLKAYSIKVETHDNKIFKEMAVPRTTHSFTLHGLCGSQDYDVTISALCVFGSLRTESEKSTLSLTTLPERVRSLQLDYSSPNSISVKWDAPLSAPNVRYHLSICAATSKSAKRNSEFQKIDSKVNLAIDDSEGDDDSILNDFESTAEVSGSEKTCYNFTKLPEIIGSGFPYIVQIRVVATSPREAEVTSDATYERFYTKPLPPTSFHLVAVGEGWKIGWTPSRTPYVTQYKIRWKPIGNVDPTMGVSNQENSSQDIIAVSCDASRSKDTIEYTFSSQSLQLGIGYKVNIHALVTTASNNLIESKELHQKIEAKSEKELTIYVPNDNMSIFSGNTG